jgi:hypothetical protein
MTPKTKTPRNAIKKFVLFHTDSQSWRLSPTLEIDRLTGIAEADKKPFTKAAISGAFYRILRSKRPSPPTATRSLRSLIDDTIAGLQLIRETLEPLESQYEQLSHVFGKRR